MFHANTAVHVIGVSNLDPGTTPANASEMSVRRARIAHPPIEDYGFETPEACVQWRQIKTYDLYVLDHGARVDLDL